MQKLFTARNLSMIFGTSLLFHFGEVNAQLPCNRVAYLSGEFNNEKSLNSWTVGSGWAYNDASKKIDYFVNNTTAASLLSQTVNQVPAGSPVTVTFTFRFMEGTETGTTGDSLTVSYGGTSFLNIKTTDGTSGNAVFTTSNGASVTTSGPLSATNDIQVTLTLPPGRATSGDLSFTAYTQDYPGTQTNDDIVLDDIALLGDCTPFPCNASSAAQFTSTGYTQGGFNYNTGRFNNLNITTGALTPYFSNVQTDNDGTSTGISFNALGYNLLDGCMYAYVQYAPATNIFAKIDATGAITKFTVPNANTGGNNIGDVTPDGYYYYSGYNNSKYFCIDLNPARATYLQLVDPTANFVPDVAPYGTNISANGLSSGELLMHDWAYNPNDGQLYGVYSPAANAAHRMRIMKLDPLTGNATVGAAQLSSVAPNINNETSGFGSVLFGPNDDLIVFANDQGRYYRVNIATNAVTFLTSSSPSTQNDGSRCALAPYVATDFSDLNTFRTGSPVYTEAYAELAGGDVNNDNRPDAINGVWLGDAVSNDYAADYRNFSSPTASYDTYDNGFNITGNITDASGNPTEPLIAGQTYAFNVSAMGHVAGSAYWAMWFDVNNDGDFTDASDIFQWGMMPISALTINTTNFNIAIPANAIGSGKIRIAVSDVMSPGFTKASNGAVYLSNGEIEDYQILFTTPLPIDLIAFNADKQNGDALISWNANTDEHLQHFVVENSRDGKNFKALGTVQAGKNYEEQHYTFTDVKPAAGQQYYRLKMQLKDGGFKYSAVRLLNFGNAGGHVIVYPNPASTEVTISGLETGNVVKVTAMDGRTLGTYQAQGATLLINTASLTPGVYMLQVVNGGTVMQNVKLTKSPH